MVLTQSFKDVLDELSRIPNTNLPPLKENNLFIKYHKDVEFKTIYSGPQPVLPWAASDIFDAEIVSWRRLTTENDNCKAVYEVTFDVEASEFSFKAGDTIGIIPHNISSEVETVLKHLGLTYQAHIPYSLTVNGSKNGTKIPPHVPVKSTLSHMLTFCVDLRGVLKKLFLLALSRHTKDENERRILEYLCSKEGAKYYETHILHKNLTLLNIFCIFKTCKPPIEVVLAHLPRLLPRPYSIVNSGFEDCNLLKICFSVTNLGNKRKGLVTGYLEDLFISDMFENLKLSNESSVPCERINNRTGKCKVPLYIRKNVTGFNLPEKLEAPKLLIGPGTGVGPFLAFLEEIMWYKNNDPDIDIGETWLYFGCRNRNLDYIYEKEINEYLKMGVLTKMRTAFSRMEDSKYKYIQDALSEDSENIVKLIKNGGYVFICGDVKTMVTQVREVLVEAFIKYDGKSLEEANVYISELQKENRYIVESWN